MSGHFWNFLLLEYIKSISIFTNLYFKLYFTSTAEDFAWHYYLINIIIIYIWRDQNYFSFYRSLPPNLFYVPSKDIQWLCSNLLIIVYFISLSVLFSSTFHFICYNDGYKFCNFGIVLRYYCQLDLKVPNAAYWVQEVKGNQTIPTQN